MVVRKFKYSLSKLLYATVNFINRVKLRSQNAMSVDCLQSRKSDSYVMCTRLKKEYLDYNPTSGLVNYTYLNF